MMKVKFNAMLLNPKFNFLVIVLWKEPLSWSRTLMSVYFKLVRRMLIKGGLILPFEAIPQSWNSVLHLCNAVNFLLSVMDLCGSSQKWDASNFHIPFTKNDTTLKDLTMSMV